MTIFQSEDYVVEVPEQEEQRPYAGMLPGLILPALLLATCMHLPWLLIIPALVLLFILQVCTRLTHHAGTVLIGSSLILMSTQYHAQVHYLLLLPGAYLTACAVSCSIVYWIRD